jgi:hypothetical protein
VRSSGKMPMPEAVFPERGRMRRRDFMAGSAAAAALGVAGWPVRAETDARSPVPKRIAIVHPTEKRTRGAADQWAKGI